MEPQCGEEVIVGEFLCLVPTKNIAEKHGLSIKVIRALLKARLGAEKYAETYHKIGAMVVAGKLKSDTEYFDRYSEKMKTSVSAALNRRMKALDFRKRWVAKAAGASRKGNEAILQLLEKPDFLERWREKCRRGGRKSTSCRLGIHNPANRERREAWSLKGLRNTSRKMAGPRGERMYNWLEVRTAHLLHANGIGYEYEKVFKTTDGNCFLSVDFFLNGETPMAIEVTYWNKVHEKAERMAKKFGLLGRAMPGARFILVTKRGMVHKYKSILPKSVLVVDLQDFECRITGSGVTFPKSE